LLADQVAAMAQREVGHRMNPASVVIRVSGKRAAAEQRHAIRESRNFERLAGELLEAEVQQP